MFGGPLHEALSPGAIQVQKVVLDYPIYHHIVADRFRAILGSVIPAMRPPVKRVLDQVSFSVGQGEVVGIVGMNGAGKTSLLKIISGLVSPTQGSVKVGGRIMALLAMGVGFRPNFTGRENLVYGGLLLGLERSEIERLLPSIMEFSGLEDALDQPFFTYSSGMRARLAFSLATGVPADILILDETLATGDARFVSKCYQRLGQIQSSGRTILFVSHNLGEVARLTSRVIVLERGRLIFDGEVIQGLKIYERALAEATPVARPLGHELGDIDVSLAFKDENGESIKVAELGLNLSIELTITCKRKIGECFILLQIWSTRSSQLYAYLSVKRWETLGTIPKNADSVYLDEGETIITWQIPHWICGEGSYFFDVYIGPACDPDSIDMSQGRFWRHLAKIESVYGNAYLKGACTLAELPVGSVVVRSCR